MLLAPLFRRADVADRGVEPDVPVVAGTVGNLEAEVRRRPRNVPIVQRLAEEMALQIVGDLGLKVFAVLRPLFEKPVQLFDIDEQVIGLADFRRAARERAHRVDQLGRAVMGAALVAIVAVLARRLALRASPLDEPIGQKRAGLGVVKLRDLPLLDQPRLADFGPNLVAGFPSFRAVGAAVIVELDVEAGEVGLVGLLHLGDPLFLGNALLPGTDHDGRAVGVVAADVDAPPPAEFLEPDPDVGLEVPTRCPMWIWPLA